MDHLREALTDPCPEGSIMPLTVCHARLVGLESASDSLLLSNVTTKHLKVKRRLRKRILLILHAKLISYLLHYSCYCHFWLMRSLKQIYERKFSLRCIKDRIWMWCQWLPLTHFLKPLQMLLRVLRKTCLQIHRSALAVRPCLRSPVGHLQLLHPWKEH